MYKRFTYAPIFALLCVTACLGKVRSHPKATELRDSASEDREIQLVATGEVANYFRTIGNSSDFAKDKLSIAETPVSDLMKTVKSGVSATKFVANNKQIDMSEAALAASDESSVASSPKYSSVKMNDFLKQSTIDLNQLTPDDMASAYMAMRALLSGETEASTSGDQLTLNLVNPTQKIRDLTKLADLGKKTWDNLLTGVPAALDPETWKLIDRNRRILSVAVELVDRAGPKDFKTRSYNRMMKHMIRASEIITGPTAPTAGAQPQDVPDWDP